MKRNDVRAIFLSAGLFALSSLPTHDAMAAASAKAELLNVAFTLVDLDTDDAVTPALTFSMPDTRSSAYGDPLNGFYERPSPEVSVALNDTASSFMGSTEIALTLSGSTSRAQTTPTSLVAEASTSHGTAHSSALTYVTYFSQNNELGFSLTPRTSLTLSGDAALHVMSDGASSGITYWLNSYADASVRIEMSTMDGFPSFDPSAQLVVFNLATPWETAVSLEDSRHLSLTLTNSTAEVMNGRLRIEALVWAHSPAIPEPDTWALMTCGILLVVVARLGNKRRIAN